MTDTPPEAPQFSTENGDIDVDLGPAPAPEVVEPDDGEAIQPPDVDEEPAESDEADDSEAEDDDSDE